MKLKELIEITGIKQCTKASGSRSISGCYIGDILSLAMTGVKKDNIWITAQCGINAVAVAVLTGAAGIIICDGFEPEDGAAERAEKENVAVFTSKLSAYRLAKALSEYI